MDMKLSQDLLKIEKTDDELFDGGEIIKPPRKIEFTRPLIIGLAVLSVFVLAIGIGMGFAIFSARKTVPVLPPKPEDHTNIPPGIAKVTSKLASDSAILILKENIKVFQAELEGMDLKEPKLISPNIELDIQISTKN